MKKLGIAGFIGCLAMFFVLAAGSPVRSEEKEFRFKYANVFPPVHKMAVLADQWCKEVEKRTDGRVTVAFFPAGTLVSANQTYDGVVKGIVDIGLSIMSYTPGRMPLFRAGVTSLPSLTKKILQPPPSAM